MKDWNLKIELKRITQHRSQIVPLLIFLEGGGLSNIQVDFCGKREDCVTLDDEVAMDFGLHSLSKVARWSGARKIRKYRNMKYGEPNAQCEMS